MDFLTLMSLKGKAEKLSLSMTSDDALALLEPLGFNDRTVVDGVLSAARTVATDPMQTVSQFVQDGGLVRLLAGQKSKPEDAAIECPHCNQVIFMTLT